MEGIVEQNGLCIRPVLYDLGNAKRPLFIDRHKNIRVFSFEHKWLIANLLYPIIHFNDAVIYRLSPIAPAQG
ncbi:MAG: hypothetical protein R2788_18545 [Saprospiraceae bacterium]